MRYDERPSRGLQAVRLQRVMIVGSSGAGKSTLARHLGRALGLPVHHLDTHFWLPGWEERPRAEFRARQHSLVCGERWVIDGNYRSTMDIRLLRADTVIMIDVPRWQAIWRVVVRRWRYHGRARPDLTAGCPEKLDWAFIRWIWSYPHGKRADIVRRVREHSQVRLLRLDGPAAVRRFTRLLQAEGGAADLSPFEAGPEG